ncbi:hypothetical protein GCM10009557_61480 [Virgisporangium ochraceum]|uniref:Uncharacterized protein n=1 Tax=Virgisporangium ochraceum TaxID=65505 RepID=A0A8J4EE70_9ACTN|nr:hypothetical protein [Virgisporangium ochraceum]GIJ71439.1 hypothetical protein Voc01_063560 [Virgisporangium ochraceum]
MRIRVMVLVAAVLAGLLPATPAAATAPGGRAMWLWSTPAPAEVVAWAQAHDVREILAYTPTQPDLAWLRELRARSAAAGISLAALGGDPSWTTQHAAAVSWARAVTATGLFDALHVDVEPHLLPAWNTDRAGTATRYLAMLDKLNAASSLPLEADVAFWYGEVALPKGTDLATQLLRRVDAVTVMSYRDTATGPNSVTAVGADLLAKGSAAGRPVRLGTETQPLIECTHCTFAEEGADALEETLAEVTAEAGSYPAFAGVAVHHYDSWRTLA